MPSHRFRWVFCQLEVLRHCFPANLRHTLEELPKLLDETYKRILNEINNANRVHAYRLLQCLAVALRPLLIEELTEVLAFDLTAGGIPKLNADWRWEDQEEAVLSACSSLVSVIIYNGSRIVQFSHFSVKEFLTSERLASCVEEVSQFHIPIEPSHLILAKACLGVLFCLDDRTNKESIDNIPLYRYATAYWVEHAQVGHVELQIKDALDHLFDMDNPHFSALARVEYPHALLRVSMDEEPTGGPRSAAPLYFAAWKGLHGLVERLIIKHSRQVNQLGGIYGTPLHASVRGGHIAIFQLLFAHGADINSLCGDNFTPLHVASEFGHVEIVKWLLDHGADVNPQEERGWTPLHFAAARGHIEVCRILLERNAKVDPRNSDGATPFLIALGKGHPNVARLLLDHNADLRVQDNSGNTSLHFAAGGGPLEIAHFLLEHDADINSQNDKGLTPLHLASETWREGSAVVMRLLLDHGANVQARNLSGKTASELARGPERQEILRLISQHAAERRKGIGYSVYN
jgi:ankyrin repeat protein